MLGFGLKLKNGYGWIEKRQYKLILALKQKHTISKRTFEYLSESIIFTKNTFISIF